MKAGELLYTARLYLPEINLRILTMFYNQAVKKMSVDINLGTVEETATGDDVSDIPQRAFKIHDIKYNDESIDRVMR